MAPHSDMYTDMHDMIERVAAEMIKDKLSLTIEHHTKGVTIGIQLGDEQVGDKVKLILNTLTQYHEDIDLDGEGVAP